MARLTLAIATTLAVSLPAFAPTEARAQLVTPEDRCQADLAKTARKYLERVLKYRIQCQNKVITGDLPLATDCLFGYGDDVLAKKLLKTQARLSVAGTACNGVNLALLGFPNLCDDDSGPPFDTSDFKQCVLDRTDLILDELLDIYYPPLFERQRGDIADCLQGTPRDAMEALLGKIRARERCLVSKAYGKISENVKCYEKILPFGSGTGDPKTDDALANAYTELLGNVPKACAITNINDLGYDDKCEDETGGTFNIFDLKNCLFAADREAAFGVLGTVFPTEGVCGDGTRTSDEECDNGSANSDTAPNACRTDCTNPRCGDDVQDSGEACDDGNLSNTDCCLTTCQNATCGDGFAGCGEQCDNGAANANEPDKCRATGPNACRNPRCGDSIQDTVEECDDGNTVNEDLCSSLCFDEFCGDEIVQEGLGEQCDDGVDNGTGPGQCRPADFPSGACKNPRCGDTVTDSGEQCDDGNTTSDDGCSSTCQNEGRCGDGVIQPAREQCDDGDTGNSDSEPDACRTDCTNARCQDGVTDPGRGETCDDGNSTNADSCRNDCHFCGDGIEQAGAEECDDGVTGNSDSQPDACRTNCQDPGCGDGVTDPGNMETCDDANSNNTDSCRNDCGSCGDGAVQLVEACDGSDAPCPGGICKGDCTCETVCPTEGELVLYAGVGRDCVNNTDCPVGVCDTTIDKCRTVTRLDSGWIGLAHNADINDEVVTRGFINCEDSHGPTCGVCEVDGVDPQTNSCRCSNDTRRVCDDKFAVGTTDCRFCSGGALNNASCNSNTDCVSPCTKRCTGDPTRVCSSNTDCLPLISYGTCGAVNKCANNVDCSTNAECASGTCTGLADCQCYFGAPFPLSSGGTPACVVNRFSEDVSGTANVDLGAGEITAKLRTFVHLGFTNSFPCPMCGGFCSNALTTFCTRDEDCPAGGTCTDDPVANDGLRQGTCFNSGDYLGGDRAQPCDKGAFNSTFPAHITTDPGPDGGWYSLDCLPANNVSGSGLVINLTQSTGAVELSANVSCTGPGAASNCPCLVCSNDGRLPCNTDEDCTASPSTCELGTGSGAAKCFTNGDCASATGGNCITVGTGTRCQFASSFRGCTTNAECQNLNLGTCPAPTCSAIGTGSFPSPNDCIDEACTDLGEGVGTCTIGPEAYFCDGLLRANGEGLLSCSGPTDNVACEPSSVGVDAGACALVQQKSCFPDPIRAQGDADPSTPIGAAVFCIPPTGNSSINNAAGLPGPGRVVNQAKARTFCGNNTNQQYIPGVGGCATP